MMQKVEIIIEKVFLRELLEQMNASGITRYSVLDIAMGEGSEKAGAFSSSVHRGYNNVIVFCICNTTEKEELFTIVEEYIKLQGGLVYAHEVEVPGYLFT